MIDYVISRPVFVPFLITKYGHISSPNVYAFESKIDRLNQLYTLLLKFSYMNDNIELPSVTYIVHVTFQHCIINYEYGVRKGILDCDVPLFEDHTKNLAPKLDLQLVLLISFQILMLLLSISSKTLSNLRYTH